jgi:ABC-type transport system involved in cytochrome c biogenesis permease component
MNAKQDAGDSRVERPGAASPGWWLMLTRELNELWFWGRALTLLLLFSVLLGITSFLMASNSELDLIPPKEIVFLMLQIAISFGLFIGLIIGADSISGERERATLEALLLTPTGRRHIVLGKFLAGLSPWPAALIISSVYVVVLSQGDAVLGQALLWSALLGTVLAVAFTGFGMLVSIISNSNRTSIFVSLIVYLLLLIPTQFPGTAQTGGTGQLVKKVNPIEATNQFLEKVLVNNRTVEEMASWLQAPILFAAIVLGLLFLYFAPRLRLEGGLRNMARRPSLGRAAVLLVATTLFFTTGAQAALALQTSESSLQMAIDMAYAEVKTGDEIEFATLVTYDGDEESSPIIVAMNIVNLEGDGDPVDPEDWSPERTQSIESMSPGQSVNLTWTINPILEGDYMVYMVALQEPDGPEETSQPVASTGIHLTVEQFTSLNPSGVLPFAVGIPLLLLLAVLFLFWLRRRRLEAGGY